MKIFLVYAFQPDSGRIDSPYCITSHLHKYLSDRAEVTYDVWDSKNIPEPDEDTVFIGHPHYDKSTITQQVFARDLKFKAKCTIHPFHHKRPEDNWPFDEISKKADKIFSICGPYWYDSVQNTQFAHWKPKMTRIDMAVDKNHFPFLRKKFNIKGKRTLAYIGSSMPQKNLGMMIEIMKAMPDITLNWYGGDGDHPLAKLKNVQAIGWRHLTKKVAQSIIDESDIFISTSISDANPTTLLESRAWGLITACTKESGYYNDEFFTELIANNVAQSVSAIRELLNKDEKYLMQRAINSRVEIENKYNWDNFCETVWCGLQCFN